MNYSDRLKISIKGDFETKFYTKSNLFIAQGYERIVIGKRGPYIEFNDEQICASNFDIPKEQQYRLISSSVYYIELRTTDECYVKTYYQLRKVDYADYIPGKIYISPFDLKTDKLNNIIDYGKKKEI